jgi:hypothetical protein
MNAHVHSFDYPDGPGHRGVDTSIEAAEKMAPAAAALRVKILKAVAATGQEGLTVLEGCAQHGWDRFGAQPRFTELKLAHEIVDSGQRRRNPSGVRAIVRVVPAAQACPETGGQHNGDGTYPRLRQPCQGDRGTAARSAKQGHEQRH